jgi:uncharacterized integral membrane protein (TIGR00698 family)
MKKFLQTNLLGKMPGILLSIIIALPAWFLGRLFPIIGGPVLGITFGMIATLWKRPSVFQNGIQYTAKKILQGAIILIGFEMNLFTIFKVGRQSLFVMIFTLSIAFITAWLVGKALKLQGNLGTLIGVGTAICGGSAIAATAPVIKASDKEVAYSISTIFFFNIAAVFIFPFIGHLLGMGNTGFGMWAGTAINDTSSVVAAGYSYSNAAGNFATIVKLTRTLMIIPVTLFLAIYTSRKKEAQQNFSFTKIFPWFVLGFVIASIINTTAIFPHEIMSFLSLSGKFLIVVAMTAIGLNTHIKEFISHGIKPILLGLACWFAVAVTSLFIQHLMVLW